jgi:hypothetical protein
MAWEELESLEILRKLCQIVTGFSAEIHNITSNFSRDALAYFNAICVFPDLIEPDTELDDYAIIFKVKDWLSAASKPMDTRPGGSNNN